MADTNEFHVRSMSMFAVYAEGVGQHSPAVAAHRRAPWVEQSIEFLPLKGSHKDACCFVKPFQGNDNAFNLYPECAAKRHDSGLCCGTPSA